MDRPMNTIAEFLFYLLGGVPIATTPWIVLWAVFFAILIFMVYMVSLFAHDLGLLLVEVIALVCIIALGFICLLPPIIQTNLMSECRTVETEVSIGFVEPKIMTLSECRHKDNYYTGFGLWTFSLGSIQ
jgi:hypothetical protein